MNSFSKEHFEPILKAIGRESFVYLANFGNYGDSLIREGTLQLFNDANLDYVVLQDNIYSVFTTLSTFRGGGRYKTFVYGGGGAWIHPYFELTAKVLMCALEIFDRVIVLPSTYFNHRELAHFLQGPQCNKLIMFRRDDYVSKEALPEAVMVPDMALYIHNVQLASAPTNQEGYFFRNDIESTRTRNVPVINFNLSALGNEKTDVSMFFNEVNKYATIYTDRLHVCIAGFLLGKKVFFHDNSYHKNKSFYLTYFKSAENIVFIE